VAANSQLLDGVYYNSNKPSGGNSDCNVGGCCSKFLMFFGATPPKIFKFGFDREEKIAGTGGKM
jgi:hypothetical protein